MLHLVKLSRDPVAIPLGGGAILYVRPITSIEKEAADGYVRGAVLDAEQALVHFAQLGLDAFTAPTALLDQRSRKGFIDYLMLVELVWLAGDRWEGIGDEAGKELPLDRRSIALLLLDPARASLVRLRLFEAYHAHTAEKKDCAPSQNGTAAGEPPIAPAALNSVETAPRVQ